MNLAIKNPSNKKNSSVNTAETIRGPGDESGTGDESGAGSESEPGGGRLPASQNLSSNAELLLDILKSQHLGQSSLPSSLGLSLAEKQQLLMYCQCQDSALAIGNTKNDKLRLELLELRELERADLFNLLAGARNEEDEAELWIAKIIAAASLDNSHLWRALGLQSRADLKVLLLDNFYSLASQNTKKMRWKKFFYKQLCEQGGHYICRSPSCDNCTSYDECFGEEE
ncbi:nitrogen fixation protein NifQ [Agaribacterium haliotis]|uniref:nitrogen fixation protein NifQ n=1 Tax=Agaribacterium haliotis TaxID=2013869 RepID=UPI000BB5936B|nr:nitrogen fixation protein NifQ [Agaribacterium haliotis]